MRETSPLLAVDTAYKRFSVAVWDGGDVFEIREREDFRHVERLNLTVKRVLEKVGVRIDDLKGILLTVGPGYFTSLRVAASFVKALHLVLKVPVYGFNTLQAMAVGLEDGRYAVTLDARKGQVYARAFRVDGGIPVEDDALPLSIYDPETLPPPGYRLIDNPDDRLRASNLFPLYFAGLGLALDPRFSPLYVRPPDAVVNRRTER